MIKDLAVAGPDFLCGSLGPLSIFPAAVPSNSVFLLPEPDPPVFEYLLDKSS